MKQIQKMQAGNHYLIESTASANSVYFEDDALAKLFFRYCNYYLKDYVDLTEYALNQDGWVMLIKVKSAQTIRKYYNEVESQRKDKSTIERQVKPKPIWKIISERVRLFISTYVRMSNKILGREGTLVRRKYTRYSYDSIAEVQAYISKIRLGKHELQQSEEKYRGFKDYFRMSGNLITNPFKSSLWIELCEVKDRIEDKLVEFFGQDLPVLKGIGDLVVPKSKYYKSAAKPADPKPPKQ